MEIPLAIGLMFFAVLYLLQFHTQRRTTSTPRVVIPRGFAAILGSRDNRVIWSTLTVQVTLLIAFITFVVQGLYFEEFDLVVPGILGLGAGLIFTVIRPSSAQ